MLRRHDRPERAHAIGQHWHGHARPHPDRAPPPAAKAGIGHQRPVSEHRDHELGARTRLGNLEIIGAGVDQHPVDAGRYADRMEQRHHHRDGDVLQYRLERVAERHHEEGIGDRKRQRARHVRPQHRDRRTRQHRHQRNLPHQRDFARIAQQPRERRTRDDHHPGRPADRRDPRQPGAARPHQPRDHRRDEQAVAERRTGPPDARHRRHIGAEQQQQRSRTRRQREEVPPPPAALSHRRVGHAGSPTIASSGASRAAQS